MRFFAMLCSSSQGPDDQEPPGAPARLKSVVRNKSIRHRLRYRRLASPQTWKINIETSKEMVGPRMISRYFSQRIMKQLCSQWITCILRPKTMGKVWKSENDRHSRVGFDQIQHLRAVGDSHSRTSWLAPVSSNPKSRTSCRSCWVFYLVAPPWTLWKCDEHVDIFTCFLPSLLVLHVGSKAWTFRRLWKWKWKWKFTSCPNWMELGGQRHWDARLFHDQFKWFEFPKWCSRSGPPLS